MKNFKFLLAAALVGTCSAAMAATYTDKDGNEYKKMIMVKAHLFTADQVKAI